MTAMSSPVRRHIEVAMRQLLRTVFLFGALGLAGSIAVAWLSAATIDLWSNIWLQRHGVSSGSYPCWGLVAIEKPSATYVFRSAISRPHGLGVDWLYEPGIRTCGPGILEPPFWSDASRPPSGEPFDTFAGYAEDGRGWPFICLTSTVDATISPGGWTYGRVSSGLPLRSTQGVDRMPRSLPLRPVWANLLFNAAFYGLLMWLGFRGLLLLPRRYRERHGRCGSCGYAAGSSSRCPECGEPFGLTAG